MGNCQAVDAAALVIQHPNGKEERLYWPITASEVTKMNPGHYVSLIIPISISSDRQENPDYDNRTVQYTRAKLLHPSDNLVLGRAYRLITTQEVKKVLRAKKYAKMRKSSLESGENLQRGSENQSTSSEAGKCTFEKNNQVIRVDRHRQRPRMTNFTVGRSNSWRPSLHSISES